MRSLYLLLSGIGMGLADLVPGISGGTIAFILGIYEELIQSIKNPFRSIKFLAPLLFGMLFSILAFSQLVHFLLNDPFWQKGLFSAFFGLVLGSLYFIVRRIPQWRLGYYFTFTIGAIIAFFLSGPTIFTAASLEDVSNARVFFSGMVAISAMLLPGISGSYLLVILGLYQTVMEALVRFSNGLLQKAIDWSATGLLFWLGLGILAGALLFSRVISWLLASYHNRTIALLSGMMFGALRAVTPFGVGDEVQLYQGLFCAFLVVLAFFAVLAIENGVKATRG
jgi:putative membrane protein